MRETREVKRAKTDNSSGIHMSADSSSGEDLDVSEGNEDENLEFASVEANIGRAYQAALIVLPLPALNHNRPIQYTGGARRTQRRKRAELKKAAVGCNLLTKYFGIAGPVLQEDEVTDEVCDLAIPIFEAQFPGCQALFAFDNATGHSAFAPDALRAGAMNLSSVVKQPKMRATTWGYGVSQDLVFAYDHPDEMLRGQAKRLKVVLEERGLWEAGLRARCKLCPVDGATCCARKIMANQSDFKAQVGMIEERIVAAGHQVIFYPKFHCELNCIENFWAAAKRYARKHCVYTWKYLPVTVPAALASVPLDEIRRHS
ncbi:unnamed protein product [Albugo candida]|uniref:Uncharacterized protein n=1 Tax=Albugo candida TaxID=65357 RepID=A0A024FTU3_9STRA|nr:unnamed protein product [Albugo candida]|eukprot:CCI10553.1 unnamed protein product [Albugo candida]